jgi:hypothetical protein
MIPLQKNRELKRAPMNLSILHQMGEKFFQSFFRLHKQLFLPFGIAQGTKKLL